MEIINQIILSIVQGLTEFLPVSSSGHLAVLQNLFGDVDVSFDIFLHFATLLAVIVYFYKDICNIIKDFLMLKTKSDNFKLAIYLIVASIPVALIGFLLKDYIDAYFSSMLFVSFGFIISGFFLFAASKIKKNKKLSMKNTFIIGLAQAIAILPGISRSGSTVSTGLLQGIKKDTAIKFSFLLSIPAIIGATAVKVDQLKFSLPLMLPFIIAFFTGMISIYTFLNLIKQKNLKYFAYYCWLVALLVIVLLILKVF